MKADSRDNFSSCIHYSAEFGVNRWIPPEWSQQNSQGAVQESGNRTILRGSGGHRRAGRLLNIPASGSPPPSTRRMLLRSLSILRPHLSEPRIARIFTNGRRPRRRHSSPAPFVSIRDIRGSTNLNCSGHPQIHADERRFPGQFLLRDPVLCGIRRQSVDTT